MTNQHPITPPPELVQQWLHEVWHEGTPVRVALSDEHIANRAAQWGADQELEACVEWIANSRNAGVGTNIASWIATDLHAARRPKPPSLKEQALETLEDANLDSAHYNIILRALESIDD